LPVFHLYTAKQLNAITVQRLNRHRDCVIRVTGTRKPCKPRIAPVRHHPWRSVPHDTVNHTLNSAWGLLHLCLGRCLLVAPRSVNTSLSRSTDTISCIDSSLTDELIRHMFLEWRNLTASTHPHGHSLQHSYSNCKKDH
jgi:hypothetical protein